VGCACPITYVTVSDNNCELTFPLDDNYNYRTITVRHYEKKQMAGLPCHRRFSLHRRSGIGLRGWCGLHASRDIEGFLSQPYKGACYIGRLVRIGGWHHSGLHDALLADALVQRNRSQSDEGNCGSILAPTASDAAFWHRDLNSPAKAIHSVWCPGPSPSDPPEASNRH
jgi:hypothetical protein